MRANILATAGIILLGCSAATQVSGQQPANSPPVVGKPIVSTSRTTSVSVQLRTEADMEAWQDLHPGAGPALPKHAPLPTIDPAAYAAAKTAADAARALAKGGRPGAAPDNYVHPYVAPSHIILNKPGPHELTTGNFFYPPDTTGAIGGPVVSGKSSQIVYTVNQTVNVYSATTGGNLKTTTFNAFFGTSDALADPRVLWDPEWHRWVITDTVVPTASDTACFWVAASQTSSATGAWFVGRSCSFGGIFAAGDLWDYDQLGMTQDAILITGNIFSSTLSFKGAVVAAIPKALLYNGFGWSYPIYTPDGTGPFCTGTIAPPIVQDTNAYAYFVAMNFCDNTKLRLFGGVLLANEFQAIYSLKADITIPAWSFPPSAAQPGTAEVLDTLDGRFQQSSSQYGSTLWNARTDINGGLPTPYFYQIDTGANSIVQQGYFFEAGNSHDWNPSIAASNNGGGDFAFVVWSSTVPGGGTPHNAQVRFSGRQSTDALGSMNNPGTALITSAVPLTSNKQGSVQRWGDYSRVALDPVPATCGANQHAAVFNETILKHTSPSNIWGTQFGIVGFCP